MFVGMFVGKFVGMSACLSVCMHTSQTSYVPTVSYRNYSKQAPKSL